MPESENPMTITIIPNTQKNIQLAIPNYHAALDGVVGVDLHPIISWACEDVSSSDKVAVAAKPMIAFGSILNDMWAIFYSDTKQWLTFDQDGEGLEALKEYFQRRFGDALSDGDAWMSFWPGESESDPGGWGEVMTEGAKESW